MDDETSLAWWADVLAQETTDIVAYAHVILLNVEHNQYLTGIPTK